MHFVRFVTLDEIRGVTVTTKEMIFEHYGGHGHSREIDPLGAHLSLVREPPRQPRELFGNKNRSAKEPVEKEDPAAALASSRKMKKAFLALAKFPKQEQVTNSGARNGTAFLEAAAGALRRTSALCLPWVRSVRSPGRAGE